MADQQHASKRDRDDEIDDDPTGAPAPSTGEQASDSEVDDLLDEIDDVLETNAEEFVKGFVQKGGQ